MLHLPSVAKKRRSYADRSGMTTRSAKIMSKAIIERPVIVEDADGHLIRQWTPEEQLRWTFDELKAALRNRRAVEREEMLETVPQSAIKYSVNKGWLKPDSNGGGWFFVTKKAAADLDLPRQHQGRKIRFVTL